jgi:hypothetical protein
MMMMMIQKVRPMLSQLIRYVVWGSDEQYLHPEWLENKERLAAYEAWTLKQREGMVTKNTAHFQREAFWVAMEEKQKAKSAKLYSISGGKRANG